MESPSHVTHTEPRSILKTSGRRSEISYPSCTGSSRTLPHQRPMGTLTRRNGETGWPGTSTDRRQQRPLPMPVVARSKKLKNCPRNCWQRAPSLDSQTRARIPKWWQGSLSGFVRPSPVIRSVVVAHQVPVPSIVNGGTDITTTSDIPSNHSSCGNVFPIVSGTGADRSISQGIVRYTLEASGGNPLQYSHHSICSLLNRNPHRWGASWNPSWRGWIESGVPHGKNSSTSGGQSCSSKQRELTPPTAKLIPP